MIEIPLTQGKTAIVDDDDADLGTVKWFVRRVAHKSSYKWYAGRVGHKVNYKCPLIHMHRVVLERMIGRSLEKGEFADHINHDGLDNRRINLRVANHAENVHNQRVQNVRKTSCYKGVSWQKARGKWQAEVTMNRKRRYLGLFDTEDGAAKAYDAAAKQLFGEFCSPNFPMEGRS